MTKNRWRSLRSRILLLAVLTCLFLGIAALSFLSFLRHSQAASISASEQHLTTVARAVAQTYSSHASETQSLRSILPAPEHAPPSPPLPLDITGPHPPPAPGSNPDPLSGLMVAALQRENGIEGGFYAAASKALVGYAFPTHEGPGPKQEMPQREKPTIERLAQEAIQSGTSRSFRFEGPHDAVLFVASPIRELDGAADSSKTSSVTGAVWLMQRIPGFNGEQNRQLLLTSLGFGIAAIITAFLAFFVMTEIRGGVNAILARLRSLEEGLRGTRDQSPSAPLNEFQEVLEGIEKLAFSLDQKIEKEKNLEAELRHKERLSALGQFAAGVAHELRNPLATIRLRTQMSQRSRDADAMTRNSTVVLEEIDRLNTMIERLLYFSRPISLQKETVSLDELCCTVATSWVERASPVRVSCQPPVGLMLECDRNRIVQVLDNLLENAVESAGFRSGSSGLVELTASRIGSNTVICVFDNGQGFGENALRHALDPFFTTRVSGTGLGLSIASELIQAHGGELSIKDRVEGGAVVTASFPSTHSVRDHCEERNIAHD